MTNREPKWVFCSFKLEIGCFSEETVLNCHRIVKRTKSLLPEMLGNKRTVFNQTPDGILVLSITKRNRYGLRFCT